MINFEEKDIEEYLKNLYKHKYINLKEQVVFKMKNAVLKAEVTKIESLKEDMKDCTYGRI